MQHFITVGLLDSSRHIRDFQYHLDDQSFKCFFWFLQPATLLQKRTFMQNTSKTSFCYCQQKMTYSGRRRQSWHGTSMMIDDCVGYDSFFGPKAELTLFLCMHIKEISKNKDNIFW